jgi:hypothetical protein
VSSLLAASPLEATMASDFAKASCQIAGAPGCGQYDCTWCVCSTCSHCNQSKEVRR